MMKSCDLVGDRLEQLAVVDHVDLGQVPVGQLRVLAAQVVDGDAVDVADARLGRDRQRLVEGADLQSFAGQEARRELAARVEEDRGGVDRRGLILLRLATGQAHLLEATRSVDRDFPKAKR